MKTLWFAVMIAASLAAVLCWYNHQYILAGINLFTITFMLYYHPFRRT